MGTGIELAPPWFKPVRIDWCEIDFVCVTPAMTRGPDGWNPRAPLYEFERTGGSVECLERSGIFGLDIVVRDRRPILARTKARCGVSGSCRHCSR